MTKDQTKTYDELRAEAAQRWAKNSEAHADRIQTMQEQIATSPDVMNAPALGSTWNNSDLVCGCGQSMFTVLRYACINGQKHRTEVLCQSCAKASTWDFTEAKWLN